MSTVTLSEPDLATHADEQYTLLRYMMLVQALRNPTYSIQSLMGLSFVY